MNIHTQPLLSLSMIVKNEEKYLSECLDSVRKVVDEIIIVDTGSTDKTINIAESFGAKVYSFNWINDFSAARNFSLSKCTGRWILYLDADERITPESIDELSSIKTKEEKAAYYCTVNSINEHGGKSNTMVYTRLFSNSSSIMFKGRIHEQIDEALTSSGYPFYDSSIEICHLGYDLSRTELKTKAARNLNMLITEYNESKSSYYAYQLANTFQILEDEESAENYYRIALNDRNLYSEYKCIAYLNIADSELKKHNIKDALELVVKGIDSDGNNPMIYLLAARIYARSNNHTEALRYIKKALEVNESKRKSVLSIRMDSENIVLQGLLSSLLGSKNESFLYFLNKLDNNSLLFQLIDALNKGEYIEIARCKSLVNEDNLTLILNLINKHPDNNYSLEFLQSIQYRFSENAQFLNALGQMYSENDLYIEAALMLEKSLLLKHKDPSAVFHLVSVYLMSNKMERVGEIIHYAEKEFYDIPEFITNLNILKAKVKPLLQNHQFKEF